MCDELGCLQVLSLSTTLDCFNMEIHGIELMINCTEISLL